MRNIFAVDPETMAFIQWAFWRRLTCMNRMRKGDNTKRDSKHIQEVDVGYCLDRYSSLDYKRNQHPQD